MHFYQIPHSILCSYIYFWKIEKQKKKLIGDSWLSAIVGIGKCGGHFGHKWRRRGSWHHNVGVTLQTRRANGERMASERCANDEQTVRGWRADSERTVHGRRADDARTVCERRTDRARTVHERRSERSGEWSGKRNEAADETTTTTWNKKVTWLFEKESILLEKEWRREREREKKEGKN